MHRPSVADHGRGAPVLLVHGQPGLGRDWDAVVELLGDHRVLVPDRPGYGSSEGAPLSMEASAAEFARELVDRDAAPAIVVGHSYGGGIAILLAARHPDVVSGLVLVASVGRSDNVSVVDRVLAAPVLGEWTSAAGLFTLGRVLPPLRRLVRPGDGAVRGWLRATLPDSGYDVVPSSPGASVWRTFVAEQRTLLREITTVEAAVRDIRVPTVLLTGDWDVVVPPRVAEAMAGDIAGSELVRVPRAGHFVARDAPGAVADAVRRVEQRARLDEPPSSRNGEPRASRQDEPTS